MRNTIFKRNRFSIGLFLLIFSFFLPAWYFTEEYAEYKKMNHTEATLQSITSLGGENSKIIACSFSFMDTKGNLLRLTTPLPRFFRKLNIGEKATVLYNPFEPTQSYLKHPLSSYPRFITAVMLSMIPLLSGIILIVKSKNSK